MTRAWLTTTALVALGCSGEPRAAAAPAPSLSAPAADRPPPHALVGPTPILRTTAPATPSPPDIPEGLASAPKLVYRSLETGAMATRSTLVTRTLQRFENQALLTEATQISKSNTFEPVVGPFEAPAIRVYLGKATTVANVTTFTLADGDAKLVLECAMGGVQVAAASAVRRPSRRTDCGDRGRWSPIATRRVTALRCGIDTSPIDPIYPPDRREEMAFVAPPGIEFLSLDDDCVMQGGGYRFIAPNGAVAPIRPPGVL